MKKTLIDLLSLMPGAQVRGNQDIVITDVTADSRSIIEGSLFIALKGATVDGHKFVKSAFEKGALAAIVEDDSDEYPEGMTIIKVADTRKAMEDIVPYFFDYPGKAMRMIGITGTNGKTTTTNIIRAILEKAGHKVGLIGTINVIIGEEEITSQNTTPDVVDLQKFLYRMQQADCDYVVMEVSSHALALGRVAGIEFDTAVLTNITQDHLDFHQTLDNYRDAKSLLFEQLGNGAKQNKTAVLNMDDPSSAILRTRLNVPLITYGMGSDYNVYPLSYNLEAKRMQLNLHVPNNEFKLDLKITGEFNIYNVMAAVGAMLAERIDAEVICSVLNGFAGVPGRFQLVEAGQPFTVIVDYAHTPDGLENVLKTARNITEGKLWTVFGCGGDRDNKKRPIMGNIALELADRVVVTSDNPRTENPDSIIDEIMSVYTNIPAGKEVVRKADRREAIYYAMQNAVEGDVVLIAGKGHEDYQIIGTTKIHFDDREVVCDYWNEHKK